MSRLAKKICFKSSNAKAVVIENKDLNNGKGLTYHIQTAYGPNGNFLFIQDSEYCL